jgi:phosphonate transport system permease protein
MAMAFVTVGFMAKFFAEALEVVSVASVEGVEAHGASRLQIWVFALLPQAMPDIVGSILYVLDHNLRAAVMLGLVGAGGIGYDLVMAMRLFQYDRLLLISVSIYLVVTALDRLSDRLRTGILLGRAAP